MPILTNVLGFFDATTLTIASGVVTVTQTMHVIAAESATSDDLDTINISADIPTASGATNFRTYILLRADSGDTITVKHGTGNISLGSAADYVLSGNKTLQLLYTGTAWVDLQSTSAAEDLPNLDANKITSGTLDAARIPNLAASKITSGTLPNDTKLTFSHTGNYNAAIKLNTPAGTFANIEFASGNNSRWRLEKSSTAEIGANAGSNLYLLSYDDTGAYLSVPMCVIRSTGYVGLATFSPTERLTVAGNVSISGSISKGSGSFKIDHPLESKKDTHWLVHSFIEAPQADLIYRGRAALVDGVATVSIDEVAGMTAGTFAVLVRNVQVFTSNETGWTAVRGAVNGGVLTIEAQDATCTDTVSWLVVGERCDPHMYEASWTDDEGRVIVEPEKPPVEQTPENAEA